MLKKANMIAGMLFSFLVLLTVEVNAEISGCISLFTGNLRIVKDSDDCRWWEKRTRLPVRRGIPGLPGPQGEKGAKGDKGEKGAKGDKGDKGEKGAKGDDGDKGKPGDQGPQGESGMQGKVGPQGPPGATGPRGLRGAQGHPGPQGKTGPAGADGLQGAGCPLTVDEFEELIARIEHLETVCQHLLGSVDKENGAVVDSDTGLTLPEGPEAFNRMLFKEIKKRRDASAPSNPE